jgi:uncharacterized membrane protein YkvA (DUF1232 family)
MNGGDIMDKIEIVAKPNPSTGARVAGAEQQIDRFVGLMGAVRAFFAMVRDPEYHFPLRLKVAMALCGLYVVLPVDLIPEVIFLFLGLADDLALIGATAYMLNTEIQKYIARQRELPGDVAE